MKETVTSYATLKDWVAHEAIPFPVDSSEPFHAAVDRVVDSLEDSVELLGFGEALHGGEEILILRNRLFQRLVEAHGYAAIAVESSFPRGHLVNEYISGRASSSYDDVREMGFSHGFGRLDANRELVEWMREYNADPSRPVKLQFYGFDLPGGEGGPASPREVLHPVLEYLASRDNAISQGYRERLDPLLSDDSRWQNPMAWRDPQASAELLQAATALRIETEDLLSELQVRRPELVSQGSARAYLDAVHYATVARQLLRFFVVLARDPGYAGSLAVRDALMANTLAHIVSREQGRGKVLAFAHNAHLQRGKINMPIGTQTCAWWPAGAHLNEMLGTRYAVIGSAVGVSEANGIGEPETGSLEARLTGEPGPARLIPTRKGEELPVAEIAALPTRSRSTKNPTYMPLSPQGFTEFDWLAVFDKATYTRGGRPL